MADLCGFIVFFLYQLVGLGLSFVVAHTVTRRSTIDIVSHSLVRGNLGIVVVHDSVGSNDNESSK